MSASAPRKGGRRVPICAFPGRVRLARSSDDRVASAARVQPGSPVASVATDTGEDRAGDFVGEKEALPGGFERVRADPAGPNQAAAQLSHCAWSRELCARISSGVAGDSSAAFLGCQLTRFPHSAAVFLRRAAAGRPRSREMAAISRSRSVYEPTNQNWDSARFNAAYFCWSVIAISTGHGIAREYGAR